MSADKATPVPNRKICYSRFRQRTFASLLSSTNEPFGWEIRQRGDGSTDFDSTVNAASGTRVLGRPPAAEPGIMVASAAAAIEAVVSAGGEIVNRVGPHAREVVATFRDPAGNVMGISQQPGLAETAARE